MILLALLLAAPAHLIDGITQIRQGQAPWCAAAAGLMGASRLGPVPDLRSFVRQLPVSKDGIPWLELSDALRPLGLAPRVVELEIDTLTPILKADIPVILAVRRGAGRHAVLADGVGPKGIRVRDPALPTPIWWSLDQVMERWAPRQAVVLPKAGTRKPAWDAADRRYRALEWALRAERVTGADMLALYDKAVAVDPSIAPIRYNRAQVRAQLGQRAAACADLNAARALAPTWPPPAQAARALGCSAAP